MASERPRRSTRVPAKYQDRPAPLGPPADSIPVTSSKKRKVPATENSHENPSSLDFILTNPKSPLISLELSTLINECTWGALSPDSRALLSTMLPRTVFPFFRSGVLDQHHPSNKQCTPEAEDVGSMDVDAMALASEPDPSFFTDPFFEADAKTFQDHLYSGWLTPAHDALVRECTEKIKKGDIHNPWKDDIWAKEHPISGPEVSAAVDGLAGDASSLTLNDLAEHRVVRVGDVLAYQRFFSQFNRTVAKDVLIKSIHPKSRSLTVLVASSSQTHLPLTHLQRSKGNGATSLQDDPGQVQQMTIQNPSQLENALLDMDGNIEKRKRPNGNAWKSIGVWRWKDESPDDPYVEELAQIARGDREYHGTLFYLRGCFYDDQ